MLGTTLGPYTLERELGRGGMGVVYLAVHQFLGQKVAVKVLLPELSGDEAVLARFLAEARAASASRHPGIIQIFDLGMVDGAAYIAMEFLEGESLATRLETRGRLAIPEALAITRQMLGALSAAHGAGVIHRDLKPDNVFLVPDPDMPMGERAKILDFGISKVVNRHAEMPGHPLTNTGVVMGTPYYMSPEQCRGRGGIDARSDLYAVGCIMHELLTGQVPFQGLVGEVIGAHQYAPPPLVRAQVPAVPAKVDALIQRLLAKAPDGRPASAAAVLQILDEIEGRPRNSGRAPAVAAQPPRPRAKDTTLGATTGEATIHVRTRSNRRRVIAGSALGALGVAGVAMAIVIGASGSGAPPGQGQVGVDATAAVTAVAPPAVDAGVARSAATDSAIDAAVAAMVPVAIDAGAVPKDAAIAARMTVDAAAPPLDARKAAPPLDARKAAPAVVPPDASKPLVPPDGGPAHAPPVKPPPARPLTANDLAAEAVQLFARRQWENAIGKAEEALIKDSSHRAALRVRGLAACELGWKSTARNSMERLGASAGAAEVRERCKGRGLTI